MSTDPSKIHATTVLAVRRDDRTVLAADGQVTIGATVVKQGARKIRRLYNEQVGCSPTCSGPGSSDPGDLSGRSDPPWFAVLA